jgi:Family of unknown function (DUF5677)
VAHLPAFRKSFRLDPKADLRDVAVAVEAIYQVNEIAVAYLGEIDPQENSTGFRIHSLLNLLGRVFEHTQAMLVALATRSPTSSEALARIVVEGSVNVMYLATKGNAATLIRFFRVWLVEHERKLSEWKAEIANEPYGARVTSMIEERQQIVLGLTTYVDQIEEHCSLKSIQNVPDWPKSLFKRFEALGRQTDYYESYHRLSGSSHISGEDTLTWLLALDLPAEKKHQLAVEAWAYSTMMTRIACTFFIDAAAASVIAYGRLENADLRASKDSLVKAVVEIAKQAGVPTGRTDA